MNLRVASKAASHKNYFPMVLGGTILSPSPYGLLVLVLVAVMALAAVCLP